MNDRTMGRHIVIDRDTGDSTPRFRGTRIAVADVLDRVARQEDWDAIIANYDGVLSTDAIAEAVRLATGVFSEHARVPPKDVLDAPLTIYGDYVVADPGICHGTPTFRGTRLFVADALEFVAAGEDWDTIVWQLHGSIPRDALAEAVRVAARFLSDHASTCVLEPVRT